jgi:tyrosine-specific transport protein
MKKYSPQLLSATFLVAGTCIGAGTLALPVTTARAGFVPGLAVMLLAWFAMTTSALYLIEVGSWMKKEDAHVISMTGQLLGIGGKAASWFLYLFICYASLVAYTSGGGAMLAQALNTCFKWHISKTVGCLLFCGLFGPVLLLPHKKLGIINSVFFTGLIISYLVLTTLGVRGVQREFLARESWSSAYLALPLLLTTFSFQTMVPSLLPYLNHHTPSLRVAIVGGTTITFLFYLVWQAIVLGTVPFDGPEGLGVAFAKGESATGYLSRWTASPGVEYAATFFAFFALVTPFLGIGLGFFDFLSDGLNIPKKRLGILLLGAIIIIPTLFFAISYERIFLIALNASGGFGDTLLNGIFPITMVWIGRYSMRQIVGVYRVPGGKARALVTATIFAFILCVEIGLFFGWL